MIVGRFSTSGAALLKRVFAVDVLQCSRCRGRMKLFACIEEQDVARKILQHLGLPAEPLPTNGALFFLSAAHPWKGAAMVHAALQGTAPHTDPTLENTDIRALFARISPAAS